MRVSQLNVRHETKQDTCHETTSAHNFTPLRIKDKEFRKLRIFIYNKN